MKIHNVTAAFAALAIAAAFAASPANAMVRPMPIYHPPAQPASQAMISYRVPFLARARRVGPATAARIQFEIVPRLRNAAGLRAYAQAASNPRSVYYRRWLTPQQIGASFGAPILQYEETAQYFRSFGLNVNVWPQRLNLTVSGPRANVERAFGTRFSNYAKDHAVFFGPTSAVQLPAGLDVLAIRGVVGVPSLHLPLIATQPLAPVSGGFGPGRVLGYSPQQLASAYDYKGAYDAGFTGKGIIVGILGTGPISPADVPNYKTFVNLQNSSSTVTQINGTQAGDSTPPTVTGPCTAGTSAAPVAGCDPEDLEAQLDTEQVATLAKDVTEYFYLSYNGGEQGIDESSDELNQALADNKADVISFSVGGCELLNAALGSTGPLGGLLDTDSDPLYAAAAAQGIAFFVSSGDSGPNECQRLTGNSDAPSASYPATDPNVVSVGGTNTPIDANGRLAGPITTWGVATETGGAEGSGQSVLFARPDYQTNAGLTSACAMRCEPDVVLNADPITGPALLANSGANQGGAEESPIGGTSAAAPDMAAMWALVLQACKQTPSCQGPAQTPSGGPTYRLGNPNYLLYPILTNATKYAATFYDITYGTSAVPLYATQLAQSEGGPSAYTVCGPLAASGCAPGATTAGVGFDQATGLGAPFGRALIRAVVGI